MKDDIIDRLFALSRNEHGDPIDDAISEIQRLRNELAESQAREAQLRAAIRDAVQVQNVGILYTTFRLPADDSALRERLRVERERCAIEAADYETGEYAAEAIRKLGDT